MNDFQYTSQEKAIMFDHWWRGRLSNDELKAYRAAWHGQSSPGQVGQTNERASEKQENHEPDTRNRAL